MKLSNFEKTTIDVINDFYNKFNEYPTVAQIKDMNIIKTPYLYKIISSLIKKNKIEKTNNKLKIIHNDQYDKVNHIGMVTSDFNDYQKSNKQIEIMSKFLINNNEFIHCIINTNYFNKFNIQKGDALLFEKNTIFNINDIVLVKCVHTERYIVAEFLNKSANNLHVCTKNNGIDKKNLTIFDTTNVKIIGKFAYLYRIASN